MSNIKGKIEQITKQLLKIMFTRRCNDIGKCSQKCQVEKKRTESNTMAKSWPPCLSKDIYILKALKGNTLIVYDHLALPGVRMAGNVILFVQLLGFCQTWFNIHIWLLQSDVFKSDLSLIIFYSLFLFLWVRCL